MYISNMLEFPLQYTEVHESKWLNIFLRYTVKYETLSTKIAVALLSRMLFYAELIYKRGTTSERLAYN